MFPPNRPHHVLEAQFPVLSPPTASQQAARARASAGQKSSDSSSPFGASISLDEAMKILNVDKLEAEKVQKNYDHLFKINDKAKGGSFYLQSKVSFVQFEEFNIPNVSVVLHLKSCIAFWAK